MTALRTRPAGNTAAPQRQASAAFRQSAGVSPTQVSVADHHLARRRRRTACLGLCLLRVRPARRDEKLTEPRPEEWLLIEWPEGEKEPTKYWLSTLPENIEFAALVDIAKLRWRIECDYQELKQEVGFLVSERETIPPSGPRPPRLFEELAVPADYRPRGAAAADRAPHSKFDRHHAPTPDSFRKDFPSRPILLFQRMRGWLSAFPAVSFLDHSG
jgi:hypothetical protein